MYLDRYLGILQDWTWLWLRRIKKGPKRALLTILNTLNPWFGLESNSRILNPSVWEVPNFASNIKQIWANCLLFPLKSSENLIRSNLFSITSEIWRLSLIWPHVLNIFMANMVLSQLTLLYRLPIVRSIGDFWKFLAKKGFLWCHQMIPQFFEHIQGSKVFSLSQA